MIILTVEYHHEHWSTHHTKVLMIVLRPEVSTVLFFGGSMKHRW